MFKVYCNKLIFCTLNIIYFSFTKLKILSKYIIPLQEELVSRLDRKLEVLRNEQLVVSEECRINDELGENVEARVSRVARPHEAAKFRLHVEEVGKITSLLLGLSGRLARAENALMGMPDDHADKVSTRFLFLKMLLIKVWQVFSNALFLRSLL